VMVFGMKSLGKFFDRLTKIEKWMRKATAVIFIAAGIYLLLKSIFGFAGF
jgi:threonine/homoserine/homoserine lactone efflux protein